MKLKQLSCPHCGANDFDSIGDNTYRCHFCGGLSKDTPPALPKSHFSAPPQTNFNNSFKPLLPNDNSHTELQIFIIAGALIAFFIVLVIVNTKSSEQAPIDTSFQVDKPEVNEFTEAVSRQPNRSENGISAANAEIVSDNGIAASLIYFSNMDYRIRIEKPEGFTQEKKKVFVGKYFEVRDKNDIALYRSGELDSLISVKGEKSKLYSDSLTMDFSTNAKFGFNGKGTYTVFYRVWDRKSEKFMTGTIPVYIEF